jgi:hypothetical protein
MCKTPGMTKLVSNTRSSSMLFVTIFLFAVVAIDTIALAAEAMPNQCENVFQLPARLTKKERAAIASTQSILDLVRRQSLSMPLYGPSALKPIYEVVSRTHNLEYSVDEASISEIQEAASFFRIGSMSPDLDHPFNPDHYSIEQIQVSPQSVAIIKPRIAKNIRSNFATAPLRAFLSSSGNFEKIGPLFTKANHPLAQVNPDQYDYKISIDMSTSIARVVYTVVESPSGDYRHVRPGQADVFFADKEGRELPSLGHATGYRFANVVALSDTIYVIEVAPRSKVGVEGEFVFLSYDPTTAKFKLLNKYYGNAKDMNLLSTIFRSERNRAGASGYIDYDGQLQIRMRTHLLAIDTLDSGAKRGLRFRALKEADLKTEVSIVETRTNAPQEFLRIQMSIPALVNGNSAPLMGESLFEQLDATDKVIKRWKIYGPGQFQIGTKFYRVNGGFVVQRSSARADRMERRADPRQQNRTLDRNYDRSVYFLSDSGSIDRITPSDAYALGDLSIVDGHVFIVGPGGTKLFIWNFPDWR